MKSDFKGIGLADLCSWFGISRQAFYQRKKRILRELIEDEILVSRVREIRQEHKRLGGRKLFGKLRVFTSDHQIKMGRDAFFDFLRHNQLLVRKRKLA